MNKIILVSICVVLICTDRGSSKAVSKSQPSNHAGTNPTRQTHDSDIHHGSHHAQSQPRPNPTRTNPTRQAHSNIHHSHSSQIHRTQQTVYTGCPRNYYWNGAYCDIALNNRLRCTNGYTWNQFANTCQLSYVQYAPISPLPNQNNFLTEIDGLYYHNCLQGYYWNGIQCTENTYPYICIDNYIYDGSSNCCVMTDGSTEDHEQGVIVGSQDSNVPQQVDIPRNCPLKYIWNGQKCQLYTIPFYCAAGYWFTSSGNCVPYVSNTETNEVYSQNVNQYDQLYTPIDQLPHDAYEVNQPTPYIPNIRKSTKRVDSHEKRQSGGHH